MHLMFLGFFPAYSAHIIVHYHILCVVVIHRISCVTTVYNVALHHIFCFVIRLGSHHPSMSFRVAFLVLPQSIMLLYITYFVLLYAWDLIILRCHSGSLRFGRTRQSDAPRSLT